MACEKKRTQPAQTCGPITLYSYSNPLRETASKDSLRSHFSPSILYTRLKHAHERNILYFDSGGVMLKPTLEINPIDPTHAQQLLQAVRPLTPDYFPGLSKPVRIVIKCFLFLTSIHHRIAGEKVLANFCAEDQSYFGSIAYIDNDAYALFVHCTAIPPTIAIQKLKTLALSLHMDQ